MRSIQYKKLESILGRHSLSLLWAPERSYIEKAVLPESIYHDSLFCAPMQLKSFGSLQVPQKQFLEVSLRTFKLLFYMWLASQSSDIASVLSPLDCSTPASKKIVASLQKPCVEPLMKNLLAGSESLSYAQVFEHFYSIGKANHLNFNEVSKGPRPDDFLSSISFIHHQAIDQLKGVCQTKILLLTEPFIDYKPDWFTRVYFLVQAVLKDHNAAVMALSDADGIKNIFSRDCKIFDMSKMKFVPEKNLI